MITHAHTAMVFVCNQQAAVDFYTQKLGFEVLEDMPMGPGQRWIEVAPPGASTHVLLYPPTPE